MAQATMNYPPQQLDPSLVGQYPVGPTPTGEAALRVPEAARGIQSEDVGKAAAAIAMETAELGGVPTPGSPEGILVNEVADVATEVLTLGTANTSSHPQQRQEESSPLSEMADARERLERARQIIDGLAEPGQHFEAPGEISEPQ